VAIPEELFDDFGQEQSQPMAIFSKIKKQEVHKNKMSHTFTNPKVISNLNKSIKTNFSSAQM
jgi:hypothetical protein